MKKELDITCDRCGGTIHGVIIEMTGLPKITGGFYDVSEGGWHEFALDENERTVCDFCMWSDPLFSAKYPRNEKLPQTTETTPILQRAPVEIEKRKEARESARGDLRAEKKIQREIQKLEREFIRRAERTKPDKPDKPNNTGNKGGGNGVGDKSKNK